MSFDLGFGKPFPFGVPVVANQGWKDGAHAGLDIGTPVGTPLIAVSSGIIQRAVPTDSSDAGKHVELLTPSGVIARYLHMSELAVQTGQRVSKGDNLGLSGNTGLSIGPHLHFELRMPVDVAGQLAAVAGMPPGGPNNFLPSIGVGMPAEPWLPVDSYLPSVVQTARDAGIPLYDEIPHSILSTITNANPLLLVGGAAALLAVIWYRRR